MLRRLLLVLLLAGGVATAQFGPGVRKVTVDPSGSCTDREPLRHNIVNGSLWGCNNSTWVQIGGGSGSGGGTPAWDGSQIISGCGVEWVSGLTFQVGACSYQIKGSAYLSALTSVVLTTADPTNPRIDVIGVDVTGAVFTIAGTPAADPAQPTVDAATQLQLTFVTIGAGATTPTGVAAVSIYEENTEWTSAVTAHFVAASTTNPYRGTKDIEATAAVLTNNVTLTKPAAGTVDLVNYNTLVLYIRSKATWPTGNTGANAARTLSIFWRNGATQKGLQVVLRSGTFGFDSSNTTAYQQISIPTSLFNANGLLVTTLVIQVSGNTGTSSIGFYLDGISLQSGFGSAVLPTTLMNFRGTWNSTAAYNPNDTVVSGGDGYVALVANTNVAVTTTTTWASLTPPGTRVRGWGHQFGDRNSTTTMTADQLAPTVRVAYACTITAFSICASGSAGAAPGTVTFKFLKVASGTAQPTAANSINTSGVSLTTGTCVRSTTLSDFTTTAVTANDLVSATQTAVGTAVYASAQIECTI